jgi:putative endonuclease
MGHPDKRQKAYHKGFVAEYFAASLLIIKGYRICNMRHRTKLGEIDIIEYALASDLWLQKQSRALYFSQRYDIIVVTPWRFPHHFIDAF